MTTPEVRLKDLCEDAGQYGLNVPASEYASAGVRMLRTTDLGPNGQLRDDVDPVFVGNPPGARFLLDDGDLLLTRSGSVGRSFLVHALSDPTTFAGFLIRFRPRPSTDPRFLAYVAESTPFQDAVQADAISSTIQNFNAERYANIKVPNPPLDEQRRIADFLDTETARLDGLAAARIEQFGSLRERALAVLADELCGRGEPGRRIATGWPWMPDLPAAWDVGPVFAYYDVQLGKMLNQERASGRHQRPYLRNANVHWYDIDTTDLAEMSFEPEERRRYRVEVGDLLICEGGAGVAEAAIWQGDVPEIYFQKSLHRCRPIGDLPSEWLMHWLRLAKAAGVFTADGNLATIPHLTGEQLRSYRIPIPIDGAAWVARIRAALARTDSAAEALKESVEVMKERRQALITAAVTGQLEVTTARGGRT